MNDETTEVQTTKKATKPVVRDTTMRTLVVGLTARETEDRAREIGRLATEIESAEYAKAASAKTFAAQISEAKEKIRSVNQELTSRSKSVAVCCYEQRNDVRGEIEWVDADTGEVVDSRAMSHAERQPQLPGLAGSPLAVVPPPLRPENPIPADPWVTIRLVNAAWVSRSSTVRDRIAAYLTDACAASGVPPQTWTVDGDWVTAGPLSRTPQLDELVTLASRTHLAPELVPAMEPSETTDAPAPTDEGKRRKKN